MAELNQDFVTYQGDDSQPVFTVRDASRNVINISTVTEITWFARRDLDEDPALTKSMTGGGIVLLDGGVNGQFQVLITPTDTEALSGYYMHGAAVTDFSGKITTVTVGRMQVGLPPAWTYDPGQLSSKPLYQVRRLLGDVIFEDQQMKDPEIQFALDQRNGNIYGAAAECCRYIATQYARKADTVTGPDLRTMYSQQSKNYKDSAEIYEKRAVLSGLGGMPFAGGISIAQKIATEQDTDRVPPQFNIGFTDNLIVPVPPLGNEQEAYPAPASSQ